MPTYLQGDVEMEAHSVTAVIFLLETPFFSITEILLSFAIVVGDVVEIESLENLVANTGIVFNEEEFRLGLHIIDPWDM